VGGPYLAFPVSYRDLNLMPLDRGVEVDHTTIFRWIQACAVELEMQLRPHLGMSNGPWRVDETYVTVNVFVSRGQQLRPDHQFPAAGQARR
jgi:transposase-like protein